MKGAMTTFCPLEGPLSSIKMLFYLSCLVLSILLAVTSSEEVIINTKFGRIAGLRESENYGLNEVTDSVDIYLGVPYAKPPVGELRFEDPQPVEAWQGIKNATSYPPRCPQRPCTDSPCTGNEVMSEDCLYLNIYSPYEPTRPSVSYPVMVYIHGGSYAAGSANDYDGRVLAQYGVVVITMNYRLGVLGFLTTGDSDLPGQWGMYDQIHALKWVKSNVHYFRGNPNEVTIFGNSAGGSSVGIHILSPDSKGLFERAVVQSGAPNSFWAVHAESADLRNYMEKSAKIMGCGSSQILKSIECLKNLKWQRIVHPRVMLPRITPSATDLKPYIDGKLLPTSITTILRDGPVNNVPILTGTTRDEWARNLGWFIDPLLQSDHSLDNDFDDGFDRPTFLKALEYVTTERFGWPRNLVEVFQYEYTDWTRPNDPVTNREEYIQFFTDVSMVAPTVDMAQQLARRNVPIYMYTFNHAHQMYQQMKNVKQKPMGSWVENSSYHEIELNFVFGAPFTGKTVWYGGNFTKDDKEVSKIVMKLWSNFAKHGQPTPSRSDSHGIYWDKFDPQSTDYLHIGTKECSMKKNLRPHRVALWNELVPELTKIFEEAESFKNRRTFEVEMWVFIGVSLVLGVAVVVLLTMVCRVKRLNEEYKWNSTKSVQV